MTTKIAECRKEMRQLIENAVASGYGLPEPMGKVARYERLRKRARHGSGEIFYEDLESGREIPEDLAYEAARRRLNGLETLARTNGIVIFGSPLKTEVLKSEEGYPLFKFMLDGSRYLPQFVGGNPVLEIIEREHSYEIDGYKNIDLINNINRLDDVSKIKDATKGKEALAAYACIDELVNGLGTAQLEVKMASKALKKEHYDRYLRESNESKIIGLFELRDEKTYSDMEKLATVELRETQVEIKNKKKSLIAKVLNTREKQLKNAFKSYEKTMNKIGALRSYLEAPRGGP